ncbi:MAG: hypothetical protein HOW97_16650, partial [Catenulispora sp.]|nr:hypothetical protein [Catenulispora sp.]
MSGPHKPASRRALRTALAVAGCAALGIAATTAAAATPAPHSSATANPYNPSYNHPYRHGVIPTLQQNQKMKAW